MRIRPRQENKLVLFAYVPNLHEVTVSVIGGLVLLCSSRGTKSANLELPHKSGMQTRLQGKMLTRKSAYRKECLYTIDMWLQRRTESGPFAPLHSSTPSRLHLLHSPCV